MKYEISIIIPTYKRADKLIDIIQKLKQQSFTNYEIIIVDDNGVGTKEQIETKNKVLQLGLKNLRYFSLKINSGAPYARNFGAKKSKSDFIAFLDDDDEWDKEKLQMQYETIKQNPNCSFCFCNQVLVQNNKIKTNRKWFYFGDLQKKIIQGNFVGGSSNPLINKKIFEKAGGFDLNLPSCQDWDLWIRLINIAPPTFLNEKLVKIDRSSIERISSNNSKVLYGHLMLLDKLKQQTCFKKNLFLFLKLKILKHFFNFI